MQAFPDSANRLIEEFSRLPGIGRKTAQRLAFHLLKIETETVFRLSDALKDVKMKVAEKYLKKAVELMPEDATVNDHYGDILWKLNRNMQARYFWNYVLSLDNADEEIKQKINIKILEGLKNS